mgnify:CR=1 FL=1
MTRVQLHAEAEAVFRQLVSAWGDKLPDDLRTTLGYYVSCLHGVDRAANHVLGIRARLP